MIERFSKSSQRESNDHPLSIDRKEIRDKNLPDRQYFNIKCYVILRRKMRGHGDGPPFVSFHHNPMIILDHTTHTFPYLLACYPNFTFLSNSSFPFIDVFFVMIGQSEAHMV